jgi:hypothetical protein
MKVFVSLPVDAAEDVERIDIRKEGIEAGHLLILALPYSNRMPGFWRNRMED